MARCQRVHDLRQCPVVVGSPQTQTQRDQVTRVIRALMYQSSISNSQKKHHHQQQQQPQKNHINDIKQQSHDMKQHHINSPTPPSPLKIDPISLNMNTLPPNSPLNPTQTLLTSSPSPVPIMRQSTDTLVNEILIFPQDMPDEMNNMTVESPINNSPINDNTLKIYDSLSSNIDNTQVIPSESSLFQNSNPNTPSDTTKLQLSMIIDSTQRQNNSDNIQQIVPLSEPFVSDDLDKSNGEVNHSIQEVDTLQITEIDTTKKLPSNIEQCSMSIDLNEMETTTLNENVDDTVMSAGNTNNDNLSNVNDKDDEIRCEESVNSSTSNLSPTPPSNESPSISSAGRAFRLRSSSQSQPS
jgi:hypothetical protein